jgi:transposase
MSESTTVPTVASHPARSRRAVRQTWVERLQRFAESGLTPAQFCAQEAVSLPTFHSWRRRLTTDRPGSATAATDQPGPSLLPIRLAPQRAVVELALPTGAVVRVPPEADEATLRCLLRLLGVTSC